MDDTPYINDGADASLRKVVSLLNKIEAKTGVGSSDSSYPSRGVVQKYPDTGLNMIYGSNTPQQVFAANSARTYCLIQNISTTDMYAGVGHYPSSSNGIRLAKNGGGVVFEGGFVPTESIYIVGTGGSNFLAYQSPPVSLSGGGSGSGSGGSGYYNGDGIGDFYINQSDLRYWFKGGLWSGQDACYNESCLGNQRVNMWTNSGAGPSAHNVSDTGPFIEWSTVTVSGASATYNETPLEVNGLYTKTGTANGNAVYEKAEPTVGVIRINNLTGPWAIRRGTEEFGNILYYGSGDNPWNVSSWSSLGGDPAFPTVTLNSPDCLRFEGSEYLEINNLFSGNSAELFAVIKPDALAENEVSGPVIGNVGLTTSPEYFIGGATEVGYAPNVFRGQPGPSVVTYAPSSQHNSWNLLNVTSGNGGYNVFRNLGAVSNYYPTWSGDTFNNEGPFIGRTTAGEGIYFKGKIAEIMAYGRSLSPSERDIVRAYLNTKYNLWS